MAPLILINFKNYPEAIGNKALVLAKNISEVKSGSYEKSRKYQIAIAPSLLDLKEVSKRISLGGNKIAVYSQHADFTLGAYTGSIPVESLKALGIKGTLLNHFERKIAFAELKNTILHCHANNIITVVCASSLIEVEKIAALSPDFIAYEPPEIIGKDVSVTSAQSGVVVKAVEMVRKISPTTKVLCGAGVHSKEDIIAALKFGTFGVLIGHAVSKAKNPKEFLENMLP